MGLAKDMKSYQNEAFCALKQNGDTIPLSSNYVGHHKAFDHCDDLSEMQNYANDSNSSKGTQQLKELASRLTLKKDGPAGKVFPNPQNSEQFLSADHLFIQASHNLKSEDPSRARSASLPINLYTCTHDLFFAGKCNSVTGLRVSNASQKTLVSKHGYRRSPKQLTSAFNGKNNSNFTSLSQNGRCERQYNDQSISRLSITTLTTNVNALDPTAAYVHDKQSHHLFKTESNFNTTSTKSAISGCKRPEEDGTNERCDRYCPSWQHITRALLLKGRSKNTYRGHLNRSENIDSNPRPESATVAGNSNPEIGSFSKKVKLACTEERHTDECDDVDNMTLIGRRGRMAEDITLPSSLARAKSGTRPQSETTIDSQDSWSHSLGGMEAVSTSIAQFHIQEQANSEIGSNQPISAFDTDDSSTLRGKSAFARLREKLSNQSNSRRNHSHFMAHKFNEDSLDNSRKGKRNFARASKLHYWLSKFCI